MFPVLHHPLFSHPSTLANSGVFRAGLGHLARDRMFRSPFFTRPAPLRSRLSGLRVMTSACFLGPFIRSTKTSRRGQSQ